jgi:hypothetical protein
MAQISKFTRANKTLTKKQFQEDEEKIIKEEKKHIQRGGQQSGVFVAVKSLEEASFAFPRFCELACLTFFLTFLSS